MTDFKDLIGVSTYTIIALRVCAPDTSDKFCQRPLSLSVNLGGIDITQSLYRGDSNNTE